ncbi:MAG TPA: phenylalanine 4-monooxygenase [Mycobacteriales bacterium]|nr:phenylalanine 4-monooxygenase [Mycobacteriales bacterium]
MADHRSLYSPVSVAADGSVEVVLGPDHPGFTDPDYRLRRNVIAGISEAWRPGAPVPRVDYTPVEHQVWQRVCAELGPRHERFACAEFLAAKDRLGLPADHIPELTEVGDLLERCTGFRFLPVPGLAPLRTFYSALGGSHFYSTQYIRHHSQPLYTPEPDIVHEVVGHANQLASPRFAALNRLVGEAVDRTRTDGALHFLANVFWFTFEFGLVRESGELRAYGAGILSSYGETEVFRDAAEIRPFDVAAMGTMRYDITRYQPTLFAADSIEQVIEALAEFLATYDDDAYLRYGSANR